MFLNYSGRRACFRTRRGCHFLAPGPNPTDRGKKGVKRSILVEGRGVPQGLDVAGANRNDFKMAKATLQSARRGIRLDG